MFACETRQPSLINVMLMESLETRTDAISTKTQTNRTSRLSIVHSIGHPAVVEMYLQQNHERRGDMEQW
jgi:hypothetical protein